jgi:hypothetical protein
MSDYKEDRAHELGFVPEGDNIVTEKEFAEMLRDRARLTEDDWRIRLEAASRGEYRLMREKEREAQDAVNRAAERYPNAEELCGQLLMERMCYPKTIMDKRKTEPFYLVTPGAPSHVTADEYARRIRSQFEQDLIAKHEADQATRAGYLFTGIALICFAACLAWKLFL